MAKKRANINLTILKIMGARPIVFNPIFSTVGGSVANGVFLSQMLYWQSVSGDEWFYKTAVEFEKETTLTRSQQENAIKVWTDLGVLDCEVRGMPARRWFKIDFQRVIARVNTHYNRRIGVRIEGRIYSPSFTASM